MQHAQRFALDTWLDSEDNAYPTGSLRQSRRKARALFPDGKVRSVIVGIADTMSTIPARASVRGKTVSGFVFAETTQGFSVPVESDPLVLKFQPTRTGRNAGLLG